MVNGMFNFPAAARDLRLQRRNPLVELGHRKRVEILPSQLPEQVVGADARLVTFHGRQR